uniref:Laminin N-terminal domain-containing protein n=1 Tax=Glossina pallidipes TaxID=7398 RepID=A0A1B0AJK8_GLOPL
MQCALTLMRVKDLAWSIALRLLDSAADSHELNTNNGGNGGGGLFPQLFNVAIRASIRANATCGQNGREEYCKLVDAYPHKKWATQCGICNSHSSDMAKHRPIESVISNTQSDDRWWQSPTLQNGHNFEYITITLDLKQTFLAKCDESSLLQQGMYNNS